MIIGNIGSSYGNYNAAYETAPVGRVGTVDSVSPEGKVDQLSKTGECETCENRKYQDGSDEMVSFKSPAKISPDAAATRVRAHEQEHVSNAYKKAAQNDGKVLAATVSLKTGICPDCGKAYVAGGVTNTKIQYKDESNPYQKNRKMADAAILKGLNFDEAV